MFLGVYVCVLVFVCVTSGGAFLFCSPTPRFSRLRLASKHSGHTRLVLLSKVFEHFAQMAYRRTELLTVNCPKEIFHLSPLRPFISTSYQTLPDFLSFHLCSPLHRTCSGVCAWESGSSRCSLYTFASLSPFSWNSSGKIIIKKTQDICQGFLILFTFSTTEQKVLSCFIQYSFSPFY